MFSLTFKNCAPYLQVRQFANFICNKNPVDKRDFNILINYTYLNYSNLTNPKYNTYYPPFYNNVRMISEKSYLRPLMNVPLILKPPFFNWYYKWQFFMQVRKTIDKTFNFEEFETGATQAVKVVSSALVSQNYEALTGLVEDNVLQELSKTIDGLTESQRKLLIVDDNIMSYSACNMNIMYKEADNNDIELTEIGYYLDKSLNVQDSSVVSFHTRFLVFNYTFQRNYRHGEGGPWIITMANHFSFVNRFNHVP